MAYGLRLNMAVLFSALILISGAISGCQNNTGNNQDQQKETVEDTADKQSNLIDTLQKINREETTRGGKGQSPEKASEAAPKTIDIGYVNWTEGIAMTHLVEVILEEKMGYTVNKRLGYVGEILDSLAWGTNDIFLDHWLSPDSSMAEMSDFMDAGINYKNARMGLVVPEYVDANSIEDLKGKDAKFNGQIVGIDAGAEVMGKTEQAIQAYKLDYELIASSGPAMISSLKNAIQNEKPIVITGWAPHWIFSRFDLKFLKDPKLVYGETKNIHTLVRKGLEEDHPEVMKFLKKFKLNEAQLQNLIEQFAEAEDWEKAAASWAKNNQQLINSWIPEKQG